MRYEQLGIETIPREKAWHFFLYAVRVIVKYWLGWWRNIGLHPEVFGLFLMWHAAVYVTPLSVVVGNTNAMALWGFYWLFPMMITLTGVRFIAESNEHVFQGEVGLMANTVSNYHPWARFFFHPLGDGYHFLHHRYLIPWHNLGRAHRLLMQLDPDGYGRLHLRRNRILDFPHTAQCE